MSYLVSLLLLMLSLAVGSWLIHSIRTSGTLRGDSKRVLRFARLNDLEVSGMKYSRIDNGLVIEDGNGVLFIIPRR